MRDAAPILAALLVACAGAATPGVGFSPPRDDRAARVVAAEAPVTSPIPKDFRATFTKVGARFLSEGHGRRYGAVLWLNPAAQGAWAAQPEPMPDGALVVEEALEAAPGGDRPAGLWAMQKKGAAWQFFAVGPAGDVAAAGALAACAECHRAAPHDDLFVEVTPEAR